MIPRKDGKVDRDVADAITMTSMCRELHILPRAGGLLDQDSRDVWILQNVINVQNEKEQQDSKNRNKVQGKPPTR